MRREIGACLALLVTIWTLPLRGEPVLSLRLGDGTLDIPPAAISDMAISESGGITDVFLRLMPGATRTVADLTSGAAGEVMVVSVCGVTVLEAVLRDRIDSGTIYLAGTTMVRAEAMRALWHGRASCDTLASEVFEHGQ